MRVVDEPFQSLEEPVVAAGLPELAVHPLLYNDPMAVIGNDEPVQIELETVLHSGTVDLGYQAAGCGERRPIQAYPVPDLDQVLRRFPRILPASAADVEANLF